VRRLSERIETAGHMKGTFPTDLSHKVRKLMNGIIEMFNHLAGKLRIPERLATESPSGNSTVSVQSFDKEKFLEAFLGIEDIAESTLKTFFLNLPQMMFAIEQAIHNLDGKAIELTAHTMKGALAIFYAERARSLAGKIEHAAREKNFDNISETLAELKRELKILEPAFKNLLPMKESD
jgi:HPt (histidine-containing phosphotransfer) domain-containing protein